MGDDRYLRSRNENLEVHPSPAFRALFEQDQAASRLLQRHSTDDNGRSPSRDLNKSTNASNRVMSAPKKSPEYSYESVNNSDKSTSENAAHVLWKGTPAYALTWELLGIIISILFLVLGAFIVSLRGQMESKWSKQIIQATRIAPSVWPILFSGVLGNAVRRFANWRAERGIHLLVRATTLLEQGSGGD